jgi:hypothetical protein
MEVMIGALTVFLFAMARFNVVPPSRMSLPMGFPRSLEEARKWFWVEPEPAATILPPPRANTTVFRYWLYRISYAVIGVVVYLAILQVDGILQGIKLLAEGFGLGELVSTGNPTPFVIAITVLLLPMLPIFKVADVCIRRALYIRALIPAEQLRLRSRLKKANFEIDATLLQQVREALEIEGFDRGDIAYDPKPTTRSLWTKVAVLTEHIKHWEGVDKYKTAFAVLRERGSDKRSCEYVKEVYEALKGDAKTCFKALREQPGDEDTRLREERLRRDCKALLEIIYVLFSRVSLHSHYSDRDRVASLRDVGLKIEPRQGGPVPDSNDVIWLVILIGTVVTLPLWERLGAVRALAIGSIYFTATLTPLLIAAYCPKFAKGQGTRTPAIACPFVSGIIAATLGIGISVVSKSFVPELPWINLDIGWEAYVSRSYPWSGLIFLVAVLVSVSIRTGTYPDVSTLSGVYRYRQWGNLKDGLIFAGCTAFLMMTLIVPQLMELREGRFVIYDNTWWRLVSIPTAATFLIGFFVPTWFRANKLRMEKDLDGVRNDQLGDGHSTEGQTATV